jgi:hypothetical protein
MQKRELDLGVRELETLDAALLIPLIPFIPLFFPLILT